MTDSKILIVDDQESNVRLLEYTLRRGGFTSVTSTTDPRAVTALHRDHHYDLILLDLVMPGMNGFQVMEGLAEFEESGELPVVVMSADPRQEAVERFSKQIAPLVTAGPQGVADHSAGPPKVQAVFGYWPTQVDKNLVQQKFEMIDAEAA